MIKGETENMGVLVVLLFITITARAKARRGDGENVRLDEEDNSESHL